ncbi:AAA family ATPase [Pseudobutyrivibrio ruminis]|uniref:Magnesium chelatase n=1 Tax=Pseudobutyrivibrio ruminis TaxID=46206 RepID=A0A2G3DRP8_9FIRM|nr:MoxR family ATPase [Pseudobutyrivibrio ruminis]PHU33654.1 magnesium chelatase [Pseudobutyrivibrio ruminis]
MGENIQKLKSNIEQRIVGKGPVLDKIIACLLADGHVLLEDVPGVGKTSIVKALSDSIDLSFSRIQCTPDTTPSDITGFSMYDQKTGDFKVIDGPVMNNILLADELNRTSPKTQAALLEVMEEHTVTIDGKKRSVPEPFMVIATQNPTEMAGTYPIPESQMDRFMIKLSVGYPDAKASEEMAARFLDGTLHEKTSSVLSGTDIIAMRKEVNSVTIHEDLRRYGVKIVEETRNTPEISCGASPRGLLSMLRFAQALAYISERDYCIPEDIAEAASYTLPHRIMLTTEAKLSKTTKEFLVQQILHRVKVS